MCKLYESNPLGIFIRLQYDTENWRYIYPPGIRGLFQGNVLVVPLL